MRFCSNCGAENDADAKFCSSCGTLLEAAPAEPAAEEAKVIETAAEAPADTAAETVQEAAPISAEAEAPETIAAEAPADIEAEAVQEAAPIPAEAEAPEIVAAAAAAAPIAAAVQETEEAPQPQPYAAPQGQPQTYQTNYVPYQEVGIVTSSKCRTFGIIGFILAIISTAFSWLGFLFIPGIVLGFFMLAFGIVGLVFCNISIKEGYFKLAKVGKVFGIIGIVLSAVCWVAGTILTILAIAGTVYFY